MKLKEPYPWVLNEQPCFVDKKENISFYLNKETTERFRTDNNNDIFDVRFVFITQLTESGVEIIEHIVVDNKTEYVLYRSESLSAIIYQMSMLLQFIPMHKEMLIHKKRWSEVLKLLKDMEKDGK